MKKSTLSTILSNVYASCISGGMFLVTFVFLDIGLPLSLIFAAISHVAGVFLAFPSKEKKQAAALQELLKSVLAEGDVKIKKMRALAYQVKNQRMGLHINEMCKIGVDIFDTLQKKPLQVRSVQQFSDYYLDTTIKIINKYVELSKHKDYSEDIQHTLVKVEANLDNAKTAFQKQLEHMLKDDVLKLDAEMSVMEETLALEGVDIDDEPY